MWLLGKYRQGNTECKHTGQAKYILKKRDLKNHLWRFQVDLILILSGKNVLEESKSLCLIHRAETLSQGEHLFGMLYTSQSSQRYLCKFFPNKLKCEPWSDDTITHQVYQHVTQGGSGSPWTEQRPCPGEWWVEGTHWIFIRNLCWDQTSRFKSKLPPRLRPGGMYQPLWASGSRSAMMHRLLFPGGVLSGLGRK